MQTSTPSTSEDKLWAGIAHGSALVPFWGSLLTALIWFTQRRRSAYVRFHSLQALSYQLISIWAFTWLWPLLLIFVVVLAALGALLLGPEALDDETAGLIFGLGFQAIIWGSILGALALYALIGLMGAGYVLSGRDFHYPFFGRALARKVGYSGPSSQILTEQEDQVSAAIAHSTAIVVLFGVVLPLAIWLTQRDRSRFLAFQALQAAIYQGFGAMGYGVAMGLYVLSAAAFGGFGILGALEQGSAPNVAALLLIVAPMLCFVFLVAVGGPAFHLFSFLASLRVLRGHDYHYPLLGRYLRRRFQASSEVKTEGSA